MAFSESKWNVLIPAKRDLNSFFDEIEIFSKYNFIYGNLDSDVSNVSKILINWPEQLFDWKEPSNYQIEKLEKKLSEWRSKDIIIYYLLHNERPHSGLTERYNKLYNLILSYSFTIVHFGFYSRDKYKGHYPDKNHVVIEHPLYIKSFDFYNKISVRKDLNIPTNKLVLFTPGKIRNDEERRLLIKAFNYIPTNDKILIAPRMHFKRLNLNFKGRVRLKKIIDVNDILFRLMNFRLLKNCFYFSNRFLEPNELSKYMSAADIIFIPRLNSLNSGLVYLAASYNKMAVGPDIGNIGETLTKFNQIKYVPGNNKSLKAAMTQSIKKSGNSIEYSNSRDYMPEIIALKWDDLLSLH